MSKVSELLDRAIKTFLDALPSMAAHMDNKQNPHGVDKGQVGLGNVDNVKQASKIEMDAHKQAATLQHPDGSVKTVKIADGAVTNAKLAEGAVGTGKLADGAVTVDKIYLNAVTAQKISLGAVTEAKLGNGAVTNIKLANNAVTEPKIENGAVDTAKIRDGAVTSAKIGDHAVHENKLLQGAVTDAVIGDRAITSVDSGTFTGKLTALFNHVSSGVKALGVGLTNHTSGTEERHTADNIDYDSNLTVKGKIDNLILTEMGGIPDHTHTGQSPDVSRISYNDLADIPLPGDRVVRVAAYNSTQAEKDRADYVCDWQNDDVEINQAIQDLAGTGGTALLSGGNYSIADDIDLNVDGVTLRGDKKVTVAAGASFFPMIQVGSAARCRVIGISGNCDIVNTGELIFIDSEAVALHSSGKTLVLGSTISAGYIDQGKTLVLGNTIIGYIYKLGGEMFPKTAAGIADVNDIDISNIIITE